VKMNNRYEKIRNMTYGEILKELSHATQENSTLVQKLKTEYSYDKTVCRLLNIDYTNITTRDIQKLELLANYTINGHKKATSL